MSEHPFLRWASRHLTGDDQRSLAASLARYDELKARGQQDEALRLLELLVGTFNPQRDGIARWHDGQCSQLGHPPERGLRVR
jgi:hypothetical protein